MSCIHWSLLHRYSDYDINMLCLINIQRFPYSAAQFLISTTWSYNVTVSQWFRNNLKLFTTNILHLPVSVKSVHIFLAFKTSKHNSRNKPRTQTSKYQRFLQDWDWKHFAKHLYLSALFKLPEKVAKSQRETVLKRVVHLFLPPVIVYCICLRNSTTPPYIRYY